jgi:hypothetical protein
MTTRFGKSLRYRISAWVTLLTFATSPPCSAQTPARGDEPAVQAAASADALASGLASRQLLRSRRPLSADESSTLVGQPLSLSIRDRWPPRVVSGTLVNVSTDDLTVDTGKQITSLPIAKTIVVSSLPGDFVDLLGQKIQVSPRRRFPPIQIIGRVVSVDTAHVAIDTDGEIQSLPIATTVILSRTPDRDRKRMALVTAAITVGVKVIIARKCRNGGC